MSVQPHVPPHSLEILRVNLCRKVGPCGADFIGLVGNFISGWVFLVLLHVIQSRLESEFHHSGDWILI